MSIKVTKENGQTKIKVEVERFDVVSMQEIKTQIHEVIEKEHQVILDMSHVEFLDSSGLSVLISILKQLNKTEGSSLTLCALNTQPTELMEITQLNGVFKIVDSCQ